MQKLPDLEGLAMFAKVAEARGFARAADAMGVSKATVSKAVSRLEERLGTRLFHRTSRNLALTDAGRTVLAAATDMLAAAEAAEQRALDQASTPRGLVRLAAPMTFGLAYVAPALPAFLAANPWITVDVDLSDQMVDLIGGGYDVGLRIGTLSDSSLIARKLCDVRLMVVGSPAYFDQHGRPGHPRELAAHDCLTYALASQEIWRFRSQDGEDVSVRLNSRMRANNADPLICAAVAGLGVAMLPDFMLAGQTGDGRLEEVLKDWTPPPGALHLVTPPGGHRPARVTALIDFLAARFTGGPWMTR